MICKILHVKAHITFNYKEKIFGLSKLSKNLIFLPYASVKCSH
jgi:hypothetical protein